MCGMHALDPPPLLHSYALQACMWLCMHVAIHTYLEDDRISVYRSQVELLPW